MLVGNIRWDYRTHVL